MHADTLDIDLAARASPLHEKGVLEQEIIILVARKFSLDARIAKAIKNHRKRSHLIRYRKLSRCHELMGVAA